MSKKRLRECWAESVSPNQELWRLEYDAATDTGLYEIKERVSFDESNPFSHRQPTFHVWQGDKWVFAGSDYRQAYNKYVSSHN